MRDIHLFASIFKISKAGTSCFGVSTGVAYFFESSERYSIELLSSKSPCLLQRFRWGRHNHTPATETYHRAIIQTKYKIIPNHGLKMDQVPFEVRPQKLQSWFFIGTNPSAASLVGLYPPASRYCLDPQYPPAVFKR